MKEVSEGIKKFKNFSPVSTLVEARKGQATGSCMPPKLLNVTPLFINVRTWTGSTFNSDLLYSFTQIKIGGMPLKMDFISSKILFFLFKNACVKKKVGIIVAIN